MNPGGGGGGGYGPPGGPGGPPGGYGGYGPPPGGYGPPPNGPTGTQPGSPDIYSAPGWSAPQGFAPMPAGLPPGYVPEGNTIPLQGGVPWEQKGGSFLSKWWWTLRACNQQTRPFFAAAAQNEKGDALLFAAVSGGVAGAFLGLFYLFIFVLLSAGLMLGLPELAGPKGSPGHSAMSSGFAAGVSVGIGIFYAIALTVAGAIGAAVRPFVWGGVHHVVLLLFGGIGQRKTFMHTVRVAAYAEGAAAPWIWIPIAGPFFALYYGIKGLVVGYDETHGCGIGRALLALSAPFICCCGCNGLLIALGALPQIFK